MFSSPDFMRDVTRGRDATALEAVMLKHPGFTTYRCGVRIVRGEEVKGWWGTNAAGAFVFLCRTAGQRPFLAAGGEL
jgi:hypothetical protein